MPRKQIYYVLVNKRSKDPEVILNSLNENAHKMSEHYQETMNLECYMLLMDQPTSEMLLDIRNT